MMSLGHVEEACTYLERWRQSRWARGHGPWIAMSQGVDGIVAEFRRDPALATLRLTSLLGEPDLGLIESMISHVFPLPDPFLSAEASLVRQALVVIATERGKQRQQDLEVIAGVAALVLVGAAVLYGRAN